MRIFITPTRRNQRGQLYEVRLSASDGPVIVESTLDPEHAACRYLAEQGIKGQLEVWSAGRTSPRMIVRSIEKAAGITVRDDIRGGPVRVKYRPMTEASLAASSEAGSPEADNDNGDGEAEVAS